jgi:hypothetical protein
MKKNLGSADKIVRLLLAVVFAVLYFTGTVTGTLGHRIISSGGDLSDHPADQFLSAL